MTEPTTGPIQQAAARVYETGGWPAVELEDGSGFTLAIHGSDTSWSALAVTDDDGDAFVFYSLAPLDAPPEKLAAVAELLHRANLGLITETFELNPDTGEVRLRTGIDLATLPAVLREDPELLQAIVLDLSAANVGVFDRYLPGLMAVVLGDVAPAAVIAEIEAVPED
jgi:hypothetical protein